MNDFMMPKEVDYAVAAGPSRFDIEGNPLTLPVQYGETDVRRLMGGRLPSSPQCFSPLLNLHVAIRELPLASISILALCCGARRVLRGRGWVGVNHYQSPRLLSPRAL